MAGETTGISKRSRRLVTGEPQDEYRREHQARSAAASEPDRSYIALGVAENKLVWDLLRRQHSLPRPACRVHGEPLPGPAHRPQPRLRARRRRKRARDTLLRDRRPRRGGPGPDALVCGVLVRSRDTRRSGDRAGAHLQRRWFRPDGRSARRRSRECRPSGSGAAVHHAEQPHRPRLHVHRDRSNSGVGDPKGDPRRIRRDLRALRVRRAALCQRRFGSTFARAVGARRLGVLQGLRCEWSSLRRAAQ